MKKNYSEYYRADQLVKMLKELKITEEMINKVVLDDDIKIRKKWCYFNNRGYYRYYIADVLKEVVSLYKSRHRPHN